MQTSDLIPQLAKMLGTLDAWITIALEQLQARRRSRDARERAP